MAFDEARYNELTAALIEAGQIIAARLETDPSTDNVTLAVDMMRKLTDMVSKLHHASSVAFALANKVPPAKASCEASIEAFRSAFNEEQANRAEPDVLGAGPAKKIALAHMSRWEGDKLEQLADLFAVIHAETSDDDPRDIILRAMSTYRHFVTHLRKLACELAEEFVYRIMADEAKRSAEAAQRMRDGATRLTPSMYRAALFDRLSSFDAEEFFVVPKGEPAWVADVRSSVAKGMGDRCQCFEQGAMSCVCGKVQS